MTAALTALCAPATTARTATLLHASVIANRENRHLHCHDVEEFVVAIFITAAKISEEEAEEVLGEATLKAHEAVVPGTRTERASPLPIAKAEP